MTNGVRLCYKDYCKKLLKAGVTLFNINFPHSDEKKCDAITRTKGHYKLRKKGIKNLIELGAGDKVRFNFVINKTNFDNMVDYVKMVKTEFPEIFYIEFNYVKVLGYVKKRKALVPTLTQVQPFFNKALEFCKKNDVRIIVDGIPLCLMQGYEHLNIDTQFIIDSILNPFIEEKIKPKVCNSCSLSKICSGMRKDYYEIFGADELKPSSTNPKQIIKIIKCKE